MASNNGYYYTDADTVISRQNVRLPEPVQETTTSTMSTKNGGAKWTIIISSIALVVAVIALCIAAIGVIMLNNNGYFKAGPSDAQQKLQPDLRSQTTIQPTQVPHEVKSGSAVYIRWGRTFCPDSASLIYKGIAGGKWYEAAGSGSNYLCLPETPEYDEYNPAANAGSARVHSAEYGVSESLPLFADKSNHDVPCAVCQSNNGSSLLMIPAKNTCPETWTREYYGYLMAENNNAQSSEFVCVDRNLEIRPGSVRDDNGALFFPVEGRCESNLPCLPYIDNAELTCVVCTN